MEQQPHSKQCSPPQEAGVYHCWPHGFEQVMVLNLQFRFLWFGPPMLSFELLLYFLVSVPCLVLHSLPLSFPYFSDYSRVFYLCLIKPSLCVFKSLCPPLSVCHVLQFALVSASPMFLPSVSCTVGYCRFWPSPAWQTVSFTLFRSHYSGTALSTASALGPNPPPPCPCVSSTKCDSCTMWESFQNHDKTVEANNHKEVMLLIMANHLYFGQLV